MHTISVNLPANSYNILISSGSLTQLGKEMKQLNLGKKVLVISNPDIFNYYGRACIESLENAGFETYNHLITAGETHKTLQSIAQIYDTALANHLERSSTLVA